MHHPTDRITYHSLCYTNCEHWLKQETAQWVHHERSIRQPITPWVPFFGTKHRKEGKEMYLTTHSTHFIYDYMVKDHSVREKTCCCHMGYSFQLTARVLLYASSHRQDNIPRPLLHQSWSTGLNEKWVHHEGSIRRPIAPWAPFSCTSTWISGHYPHTELRSSLELLTNECLSRGNDLLRKARAALICF